MALRRWWFVLLIIAGATGALPSHAGRFAASDLPRIDASAPRAAQAPYTVKAAGGTVEVVEFYNAALEHYFISADTAEIAVLDGGAFGGAWRRTGGGFPAWDVQGAPGNTVPVCRFFGTDRYRADGSRIGPNSHFYTADPAECAFVKTAWPAVAGDGTIHPAWTFEANAFAVQLPVAGACPAGTQPLYRTYNNGARGDPNHRYSTQAGTLQGMAGWVFEGLVMCLPAAAPSGALPPQMAGCGGEDCPPGTPLGSGIGVVTVVVEIANPTGAPVELVIPAGQTFVATTAKYQDGLAIERVQAIIPAGATRVFVLNLYCMQADRGMSTSAARYAPGPMTTHPALLDIVALADGRVSGADPVTLKAGVVQFAVWEVTDGRGSLSLEQRNLLAAILATPAGDVDTQITLQQQFMATMTFIP